MTRVVIIGDVGGCVDELTRAVEPYADDPETVFVQVGDLVDRGPDSTGVLAFVAERRHGPAGRWIQLLGNHDGQYVGGEPFWPQPLRDADMGLLRSWWLREQLRVATAVRTADGEELLVTHAGVTFDAWCELGEPVSAATAADLLNTRPDGLRADCGPLWAEAGPDPYASWLAAPVAAPFGQVHGHSTIVDFRRRSWLCEERVRQRSTVDWQARRVPRREHRRTPDRLRPPEKAIIAGPRGHVMGCLGSNHRRAGRRFWRLIFYRAADYRFARTETDH